MANLYLIDRPFAESALGLLKQDADAEVVLIQDGVYFDVSDLTGNGTRVCAISRSVCSTGSRRPPIRRRPPRAWSGLPFRFP